MLPQPLSVLQESVSGLVAGSALTLTKSIVKYPLDTATVRLQMPGKTYSLARPRELFDDAYRGISVPLLANIPAGAVFFAVKDAAKSFLRESAMPLVSSSSILQTSLAVGLAQFPYWLVRNPSEVVKTRQQAGIRGFGDGVAAWEAYDRVRRDGQATQTGMNGTQSVGDWAASLQAFYVGYWENILYAYPADVVKFVTYDALTVGRRDLSPADGAWAGAVSTALAQLVTTPLDVVRNRVMCQQQQDRSGDGDGGGNVDAGASSSSYLSSLLRLAQEEGAFGLFAGATPRVAKAFLSGAIQFATYEETKRAASELFSRRQ
jgi:solute carrier family 25 S-adenosylmethionine transporter 26